MELRSLKYTQYRGEPREWQLEELPLGPVNLLVGKNATGKTFTLNVIKSLASLLSADNVLQYTSGDYDVTFQDEGRALNYVVRYTDHKVWCENLKIDGKTMMDRGLGGKGRIFAEKQGGEIEFQTPENKIAAVARRDTIQHEFFEPLHEWGNSLHHYAFGSTLGKDHLAVMVKDKRADVDYKDPNRVLAIFKGGEKEFGDRFKESIKSDMNTIGYPLDEIGLRPLTSIIVRGDFPGELVGLYVKESALQGITDQSDMSQGMFRAFSLIIQLNYSQMASKPSCILIDDIGEGLDFERSCSLIELLMRKAKTSSVQLVMSTNDRFVMNSIPLEVWSVLQREAGKTKVYNYTNSKAIFDKFKFTGMNNFDFLAVDFLHETPPSDE